MLTIVGGVIAVGLLVLVCTRLRCSKIPFYKLIEREAVLRASFLGGSEKPLRPSSLLWTLAPGGSRRSRRSSPKGGAARRSPCPNRLRPVRQRAPCHNERALQLGASGKAWRTRLP